MRYVVAGSIVVVAVLVSLYAYSPFVITWAETIPSGVEYQVDDPKSVEFALIHAYRIGRNVVQGSFETPLSIQSSFLLVVATALAVMILRGKNAE
ncbi:MAG: hypothetical protein NXI30_16940 [bacterium]|nr:hypothetical protein [bacterium]